MGGVCLIKWFRIGVVTAQGAKCAEGTLSGRVRARSGAGAHPVGVPACRVCWSTAALASRIAREGGCRVAQGNAGWPNWAAPAGLPALHFSCATFLMFWPLQGRGRGGGGGGRGAALRGTPGGTHQGGGEGAAGGRRRIAPIACLLLRIACTPCLCAACILRLPHHLRVCLPDQWKAGGGHRLLFSPPAPLPQAPPTPRWIFFCILTHHTSFCAAGPPYIL